MVPVNVRLQEVWERMVAFRTENGAKGPRLFSIKTPRAALIAACARLGLPRLTLYDMRHYFNTWAIENGVPIPTVAKWIGHKDGGALLMRTYTHLRDAHGLAEARKLR